MYLMLYVSQNKALGCKYKIILYKLLHFSRNNDIYLNLPYLNNQNLLKIRKKKTVIQNEAFFR